MSKWFAPILLISAVLSSAAPSGAQEPTQSLSAAELIRGRATVGGWVVLGFMTKDHRFTCLVMLAQSNKSSGDEFSWGFQKLGQNWNVFIHDKYVNAVPGDSIKVVLDAREIGSFPFENTTGRSGLTNVSANLSSDKSDALSRLLPNAGTVVVATSLMTYSLTLPPGAKRDALNGITLCSNELSHADEKRPPK